MHQGANLLNALSKENENDGYFKSVQRRDGWLAQPGSVKHGWPDNMAPLQLFIYPQSCCLCHKQSVSSSASILTVTLRKPKGNHQCVHWCKSSTRKRGLCKSANELLTNTRWSMEVGEWKLLTSVAAVTRSSICLLVMCCHVTVTWLAFPACSVIHDNTKKKSQKRPQASHTVTSVTPFRQRLVRKHGLIIWRYMPKMHLFYIFANEMRQIKHSRH